MNILTILLVLFLLGALPQTGWHHYGYAPSGLFGLILIILIVVAVTDRSA